MTEFSAAAIEFREQDLRWDVSRSAPWDPPAVRLTHIPSGQVVTIVDEPSEIQAKTRALRELRGRLIPPVRLPVADLDEVYRCSLEALRDHRSQTALDLRQEGSLRIVVSRDTYLKLCRQAMDPATTRPWAQCAFMDGLRLGGVQVTSDDRFSDHEVRLRTEVEA